jgi:hypothetical protein
MFDIYITGIDPRQVFRRLMKLVVVLTLTLSLGAHWMLLQSVAWVGMAVNYSQDAPFTEALSKTFDGKHPCKLCKFVEEGKHSEKKQDVLKVEGKKEFCFDSKISVPFPPSAFTLVLTPADSGLTRTETPPVPPPRGCFV